MCFSYERYSLEANCRVVQHQIFEKNTTYFHLLHLTKLKTLLKTFTYTRLLELSYLAIYVKRWVYALLSLFITYCFICLWVFFSSSFFLFLPFLVVGTKSLFIFFVFRINMIRVATETFFEKLILKILICFLELIFGLREK